MSVFIIFAKSTTSDNTDISILLPPQFSLPTPKGGKHAVNPRLVEDQRLPHQRESRRAKASYNAMDTDYVSNSSPFAPIDTDSRAAQLGIRHHQHRFKNRRNPNENKGKRK